MSSALQPVNAKTRPAATSTGHCHSAAQAPNMPDFCHGMRANHEARHYRMHCHIINDVQIYTCTNVACFMHLDTKQLQEKEAINSKAGTLGLPDVHAAIPAFQQFAPPK
jgi:hypothetical protein